MRLRRLSRCGVIITATCLALTLAPDASANNFFGASGNSGCSGNMQDNSTMTFKRTSGIAGDMYNAVAYVINSLVQPTDVTVQAELAAEDGNTDVVYQEANYIGSYCGIVWGPTTGSYAVGYTYCASLSGSRCQRFNVMFDQSWEVVATSTDRRHIACHETGHSLGLAHPTSSSPVTTCMSGTTAYITYDASHEVAGHINGNY
jgi:hypothetical protein